MQYDDEGAVNTRRSFDLKDYLRENGLSQKALSKLTDDIDSGDMNVNTLQACTDTELKIIAQENKLTFYKQKDSFKLFNY